MPQKPTLTDPSPRATTLKKTIVRITSAASLQQRIFCRSTTYQKLYHTPQEDKSGGDSDHYLDPVLVATTDIARRSHRNQVKLKLLQAAQKLLFIYLQGTVERKIYASAFSDTSSFRLTITLGGCRCTEVTQRSDGLI